MKEHVRKDRHWKTQPTQDIIKRPREMARSFQKLFIPQHQYSMVT